MLARQLPSASIKRMLLLPTTSHGNTFSFVASNTTVDFRGHDNTMQRPRTDLPVKGSWIIQTCNSTEGLPKRGYRRPRGHTRSSLRGRDQVDQRHCDAGKEGLVVCKKNSATLM